MGYDPKAFLEWFEWGYYAFRLGNVDISDPEVRRKFGKVWPSRILGNLWKSLMADT